jgi:hypothetical protein
MSSYVIICHGGRGEGTSSGTYVVPKGVTIYFFTADGVNMNGQGGSVLVNALLDPHPAELDVQALAEEVKKEYETVPNYQAAPGGPEFPVPTGVYLVGQGPAAGGPVIAIDSVTRLGDIIGGGSSGGSLGNNIYWLACRAKPITANSFDRVTVTRLDDGSALGRMKVAKVSGLLPSQVAATGKWQSS